MEEKIEYITTGQIPQYVSDEAMTIIYPYSISLICFQKIKGIEHGKPIGSGTLVKINGQKYVLTAGHVIKNKCYDEADAIGLCYFESHKGEQRHIQDKRIFAINTIWNETEKEKGPDIGLIKIPMNVESWFNAKAMPFWNIDNNVNDAEKESNSEIGATVTYGFIEEFSSCKIIDERNRLFTIWHMLFWGSNKINIIRECDGYDYFSEIVKYDSSNKLPLNFKGASGGGVWRIPLKKDESGKITCGEPFLLGMAFYQTDRENDTRELICHGWKSIYIKAKELLAG
jgi:hypothetical protein